MRKQYDPLLKCQPWKVMMVFQPLETVLNRLEKEGTVDAAGRQVVFREDMRGGWYDLVAALRGVIEFYEIAQTRHQLPADVDAMARFANKLEAGMPVFEQDITAVRSCIASCKSQAMKLRLSQATDIVQTIQIRAELDRLKNRKAA